MKWKVPVLWIIFAVLVYFFYVYIYDGTRNVKSRLDGRYYSVRNRSNRQTKADLLALIRLKLETIVTSLAASEYSTNLAVRRLITNWNRGVTIKEIGNLESDAAYVINKQYMSFCLPDDTANSLNKINLMTYVAIHELAHIMSDETGHGEEFVQNFEFLLNYSKRLNYTDPLTQKPLPIYIQLNKLNTDDNYCGVPLINSIN
jgi:beta-lactamase regulating signal transducer with metallopeptidase domain